MSRDREIMCLKVACVAGVPRGGKGESRARKARKDSGFNNSAQESTEKKRQNQTARNLLRMNQKRTNIFLTFLRDGFMSNSTGITRNLTTQTNVILDKWTLKLQ